MALGESTNGLGPHACARPPPSHGPVRLQRDRRVFDDHFQIADRVANTADLGEPAFVWVEERHFGFPLVALPKVPCQISVIQNARSAIFMGRRDCGGHEPTPVGMSPCSAPCEIRHTRSATAGGECHEIVVSPFVRLDVPRLRSAVTTALATLRRIGRVEDTVENAVGMSHCSAPCETRRTRDHTRSGTAGGE